MAYETSASFGTVASLPADNPHAQLDEYLMT
jgi:hypothetical protein